MAEITVGAASTHITKPKWPPNSTDFSRVTNHCSWQVWAGFCLLNFIIFSLHDMCVDSFKMIYNQNEFLGLPLLFLIRWKCTWIIALVIKSMCFIPCLWIGHIEKGKSREVAKRSKNKEGETDLGDRVEKYFWFTKSIANLVTFW